MGKFFLAIVGHETRGSEVIELLEMLGGINGEYNEETGKTYNTCDGRYYANKQYTDLTMLYYISPQYNSRISVRFEGYYCKDYFDVYTLEEFMEKFPFKIGDYVRVPEYKNKVRIRGMRWCPSSTQVEYMIGANKKKKQWYTVEDMEKIE